MAKKSGKIEEVSNTANADTLSKQHAPSSTKTLRLGFSKAEYWKRRRNVVKDDNGTELPRPLRGQGDGGSTGDIRKYLPNTESKAEIGFTNEGTLVLKNREYRRRKVTLTDSNRFTKVQKTRAQIKRQRKLGRK